MRRHYGSTSLGAAATVAVVALAGCGVPDDVADLHRRALASERAAVQALNQLANDTSRGELEQLRDQFEEAAAEARALRERLRDELAAREGSMFIGEKIAEATQLNEDLLRCHETLAERAEEAFRFVQTRRGRRGSVKDVWGIVDPRRCFDELAPAWEVVLE